MKVLSVIHSISPSLGGPSYVVVNLTKALRQKGVDAEIVTTNDDGRGILHEFLGKRVMYKGAPVWFFGRFPLRFRQLFVSFGMVFWLWKNIKKYDVVLVHYLFTFSSAYTTIIARMRKVPYVIRTIGQLSPVALNQNRFRKRVFMFLFDRKNLINAAAVHCATEGEADDLYKFGIKTIAWVIPIGVQMPEVIVSARVDLRDKYFIPKDKMILLFMGRIHKTKRVELLLIAFKVLLKKHPNLHLIIAGSGEDSYVADITNLAGVLNIADNITFTGFVSEEKGLILQGSDIFIMPLRLKALVLLLLRR
jgi:glycosyltransferase involved in cell wall biosynthesis